MKKILIAAGAILMMAACAKEEVNVNETPENGTVQTVAVNVEPFVSTDTKTSVSVSGTTATYSWSAGDEIGIYPVATAALSGQTSQQIKFKINGSGGATTATFSGTGWGLVTSGTYKYFAYYPYSSAASYNNAAFLLPSSYNQTANGNTDHLTGNDVLYAPQIQPSSAAQAEFDFYHLTALVDFKITVPSGVKSKKFQRMTVTAPSALFTTEGTYDPSSATESAAPAVNSTVTTDKLSLTMNGSTGFAPDAEGILHLYFYVAPVALTEQTLSINLWDIDNIAYTASGTLTKDLVSGKFYILPFTATTKDVSTAVDLSTDGTNVKTANCYIVSENGKYKFLANVKGNGVVPSGMTESPSLSMTGCTAAVIWETVNTDTAPSVGAIVSDPKISGDYIVFDATGAQGNALIALKDAGDNIVWSWHIWSTNANLTDSTQTYGGANMMDRNLGALSATPGNGLTLGFHYQWGRPCPITGGYTFSKKNERMATTNSSVWVEEETTSTKGTLAYSAANPTHFIYASASNYYKGQTSGSVSGNWLWTADTTSSAATMPLLWGATKTMYDPCPIGWKVPAGGSTGVWSTAGFSIETFTWNSTYRGRIFTSPAAYYPSASWRGEVDTAQSGSLNSYGSNGFYWSSSVYRAYGCDLFFFSSCVYPSDTRFRAFGYSVRPCQE